MEKRCQETGSHQVYHICVLWKWHKEDMRKTTFLEFRDAVIVQLLESHVPLQTPVPRTSSTQALNIRTPTPRNHFLVKFPNKRRNRCRVCYEKKVQKLSPYYCSECRDEQNRLIGLYIACFPKYEHKTKT